MIICKDGRSSCVVGMDLINRPVDSMINSHDRVNFVFDSLHMHIKLDSSLNWHGTIDLDWPNKKKPQMLDHAKDNHDYFKEDTECGYYKSENYTLCIEEKYSVTMETPTKWKKVM